MPSRDQLQSRAILRQSRRFLVRALAGGFVLGLALMWLAPSDSPLFIIGAMLVLTCWVPVVWGYGGYFLFFLPGQYLQQIWNGGPAPAAEFAAGAPLPELLVTMRLLSQARGGRAVAMRPGRHSFALVLGTEGYTVRFELPEGALLDAENEQRVAVQFLNPALALPRFTPGTAFRMVTRNGVVGEGVVVERIGAAA